MRAYWWHQIHYCCSQGSSKGGKSNCLLGKCCVVQGLCAQICNYWVVVFSWTKNKRWGRIQDATCCLCNAEDESINHLFFECSYTSMVWSIVSRTNGENRVIEDWELENATCLMENKGMSIKSRLRCLTLASVIYFILAERNARTFQQHVRSCELHLGKVEELIKFAIWNWKAKRKYKNRKLCKEWGLNDIHVLE